MRTKPRWRAIGVACALALLAAGCGGDDSGNAADTTTTTGRATGVREPSLTILSPEDGARIGGNVVPLELDVDGVTIVKPDGDTSGRTGHYHVFIDKEPVAAGVTIPREPGIVHSADDPVRLTGLSPGRHRLTVVLGDGAHTRVGETEAEVTVTTEGPSIDSSAPSTASAGSPVRVETKAEGVQIVKGGNHLHLFVDKDPTPPGVPVPLGDPAIIHTPELSTEIPDLTPGEHVIWVVVGDAAHVPLDPPVMDRVTVTVQ